MDAIIKINSTEFNEELFNKIGTLIKDRNADVTIAVHDRDEPFSKDEPNKGYWERLRKSIADIEAGGGTTFTMAELEDFIKQ